MFRVCSVSDIKENSMNKFTINKKDILIGKKDGKLFACDNWCPHREASMNKGYFKDNKIVCYMHDYEFEINSGKLVNMKSWKKSDTWMEQNEAWRASGDLIMYNVIVKEGEIYLELRDKQ